MIKSRNFLQLYVKTFVLHTISDPGLTLNNRCFNFYRINFF